MTSQAENSVLLKRVFNDYICEYIIEYDALGANYVCKRKSERESLSIIDSIFALGSHINMK